MYKAPSLFRDGDFFSEFTAEFKALYTCFALYALSRKDDCIERKAYGNS